MIITWSTWKNRRNIRKHGIDFRDVSPVFEDTNLWERYDPSHSIFEDRFIITGNVRGRILTVVFTEPDGDTIRLISARMASKREKEEYYGNR
jgi:uncharacterized DUF497 family protein